MCKPDREIHFCSCASIAPIPYPGDLENENLNQEEYNRTHSVWRLNRYLGKKNSQMLGEMIMPLQRLSEELTVDHLIRELNRKDIFDFEYDPKEGDELIIREEYIYKSIKGQQRQDFYEYMSLIYKDGCWQDEYYNVFEDRTRQFRKGVIKFNSPDK